MEPARARAGSFRRQSQAARNRGFAVQGQCLMHKIAVVSDTHNYVDPKLAKLFAGVNRIFHAGDIGQPQVLLELERIAPVTSVSGNTDDPVFRFRLTSIINLWGRKFLLQHIVNPHAPGETLRACLEHERPAVVVFGHTHRPFCEVIGGALFFNPGYAGKSRFGMERSAAILHCDDTDIRPQFLPLG